MRTGHFLIRATKCRRYSQKTAFRHFNAFLSKNCSRIHREKWLFFNLNPLEPTDKIASACPSLVEKQVFREKLFIASITTFPKSSREKVLFWIGIDRSMSDNVDFSLCLSDSLLSCRRARRSLNVLPKSNCSIRAWKSSLHHTVLVQHFEVICQWKRKSVISVNNLLIDHQAILCLKK